MELTAKIGNKLDNLQTLMDLWMGLGFMGKSYMKPIMSPNVTDSYFVQFDYFLEDS